MAVAIHGALLLVAAVVVRALLFGVYKWWARFPRIANGCVYKWAGVLLAGILVMRALLFWVCR